MYTRQRTHFIWPNFEIPRQKHDWCQHAAAVAAAAAAAAADRRNHLCV